MKNIITIDGPSGAGKSTIARLIAKRLGYKYLDTGALYRALAWKILREDIDIDDEKKLSEFLKMVNITYSDHKISVDGIDITDKIRTQEISEMSSRVSSKPLVREYLLSLQRQIGEKGNIVAEGRDTGTVIFPEARHKFFLDAKPEERGKRRYKELKESGLNVNLTSIIEAIKKRDNRDSKRKVAPLKRTEDMIYIDTTELSIEQVLSRIMEELKKP
jgi:cytidylate kinase